MLIWTDYLPLPGIFLKAKFACKEQILRNRTFDLVNRLRQRVLLRGQWYLWWFNTTSRAPVHTFFVDTVTVTKNADDRLSISQKFEKPIFLKSPGTKYYILSARSQSFSCISNRKWWILKNRKEDSHRTREAPHANSLENHTKNVPYEGVEVIEAQSWEEHTAPRKISMFVNWMTETILLQQNSYSSIWLIKKNIFTQRISLSWRTVRFRTT